MIRSAEGYPQVFDDEQMDILVFEWDMDEACFAAEDRELALLNLHFQHVCVCSELRFRPVTLGCLQGGREADSSWRYRGTWSASRTHAGT